MKDILEVLHPLYFVMSLAGVLIASIEFKNIYKRIWQAEQIKNLNPPLFEKYCKEISGCAKNARSTMFTAAILFFLTILIHTVINTM